MDLFTVVRVFHYLYGLTVVAMHMGVHVQVLLYMHMVVDDLIA